MIDLKMLKGKIEKVNGLDRLWSPDQPLDILPLPSDRRINTLYDDGFRPYAVMGCDVPRDQNIKMLSVLGMIIDMLERGLLPRVKRFVEGTSGNTGLALLAYAHCIGVQEVLLVIQHDLAVGKKDPLDLAGANFIYPMEGMSAITTARFLGGGGYSSDDSWGPAEDGTLCLDQYGNEHNEDLHEWYTGPKMLEALPNIKAYAGGIGTGGTTRGIVKYMRQHVENFKSIGVLCAPGEKIPGVRDLDRLKEVRLRWQDAIDVRMEMTTRQSYGTTTWINWLAGWMGGPGGGSNYAALLKFMKSCKETGKPYALDDLRVKGGPDDGLIPAAFMIPDGVRPYIDHFKANLPSNWLRIETAPLLETLLW
jgi:cysteine synthase B